MRKLYPIAFAVVLLLTGGLTLVADEVVFSADFDSMPETAGSYGEWEVSRGRLHQRDSGNRLAKINFSVPQSGLMEYSFDVRYQGGGLEDRMGGFGVHVFADRAHRGKSWGNGESYLLWINYDENPSYGKAGFRGQVYRSFNHSWMELPESYDIPLDPKVLSTENLRLSIPLKIQVDGRSGLVKVWDPTRRGTYIRFQLESAPGEGRYFSLRSNSLALSFDNLRIRRIE
ncbi:MAG TPA: hypothetical protein ENN41_07250 [Sediminispirochaeta sp.]|nr:hypothetical protein [Sediminispirochaeta sp.]